MLTEQTLDKLYAMKLSGTADAFKEQLQQPSLGNLSFEERFGLLVDRQWTWKEDRKMKRLLEEAKLKINASMEDIDYKSPRGIDRSVMMALSSCDWIKKHQNVILTGPTGAGKTFLACALPLKKLAARATEPTVPAPLSSTTASPWPKPTEVTQGSCTSSTKPISL